MRRNALVAIVIIASSIILGWLFYSNGMGDDPLGIAVQTAAAGASVGLTFVLVMLYKEQKNLLEQQIKIQGGPEVYAPPENTNISKEGLKFEVFNEGDSVAKRMRVVQEVKVWGGGEFTAKFRDFNPVTSTRGRRRSGTDDESVETNTRYLRVEETAKNKVEISDPQSRSVDFNISDHLISSGWDVFDHEIRWFVEYDYWNGRTDRHLITEYNFSMNKSGNVAKNIDEIPEEGTELSELHGPTTLHIEVMERERNQEWSDIVQLFAWKYFDTDFDTKIDVKEMLESD